LRWASTSAGRGFRGAWQLSHKAHSESQKRVAASQEWAPPVFIAGLNVVLIGIYTAAISFGGESSKSFCNCTKKVEKIFRKFILG
jgi:hypothetical protein